MDLLAATNMKLQFRKVALKASVAHLAIVLSALSGVAAAQTSASHRVSWSETQDRVTLANDYLEVVFDRASHAIVRLSADHTGKRTFTSNLLAAQGIRVDDAGGAQGPRTQVEILDRKPDRITVRSRWRSNHQKSGNLNETTLSLGAADRGVHIRSVLSASPSDAKPGAVRFSLQQWFLLGIFDRGVVQYIAGQNQQFISHDRLRVFYTMDRQNGSVAIVPDPSSDLAETVLVSGERNSASGVELRPQTSRLPVDVWTSSKELHPSPASATPQTTIAFTIYANDLPFPSHHSGNFIDGDDRARGDSVAYFTALYGSAAGVVGSYVEPGSAYPTLAFPDRPYGDAFDFFDPDAWSTVTALSYSGDRLLQREAQRILERSERNLRPDGQVPHHFEAGTATYVSIAKSSQTGPNIFWVIAASEYAAGSGDEAWLRAHYPHLRLATDWVLAKYDPSRKLLRADGPLFIDVFRRDGFTLDTNVAAVYLLDRMKEVAEFCGDHQSAQRYRAVRRALLTGLQAELWSEDHFITQKSPDGTSRDKVDYDGNFAALAFGIPGTDDAQKLLLRLDEGQHTHPGGRGTWVSERRYEKEDCYGDNDGDSDTAMARIWWLDMAARVRLGDQSTFNRLLDSIEPDLIRDVWMPERYDADGKPAHNGYYHEYPDIVSIVLREMRYGVHVGMREVTIAPFGSSSFEIRLGALHVKYSADRVSISVPGSSVRNFTICGLRPRQRYLLSDGKKLTTDAEGTLHFGAPPANIQIQAER